MNKTIRFHRKNQAGASLLAIIIAVLLIAGALLWAFGGGGASSTTAGIAVNVAQAKANGIMAQGNEQNDAFQRVMAMGVPIANVKFDNTGSTASGTAGVFNTVDMISMPQTVDATSLTATGANGGSPFGWVYLTGAKFAGVGDPTKADYAIALPNVQTTICEQLNLRQHGATTVPVGAITASAIHGTAGAQFSTVATAIDNSGATGQTGWTSGCIADSGGNNIYFQVIVPQ
jgi:hypothetical protein